MPQYYNIPRAANGKNLSDEVNRLAGGGRVDLQSGAVTVGAGDLNVLRYYVLSDALRAGDGLVGAQNVLNYLNSVQNTNAGAMNLAKNYEAMRAMGVLDPIMAGRGVTKAQESPAQRRGYFPQNPAFFAMQMPQAVPVQETIKKQQNLRAVLRGYYEAQDVPGLAHYVANLRKQESIIHELANPYYRDSVFMGVPKSAAVNLHNIYQRNRRVNSMYAFY